MFARTINLKRTDAVGEMARIMRRCVPMQCVESCIVSRLNAASFLAHQSLQAKFENWWMQMHGRSDSTLELSFEMHVSLIGHPGCRYYVEAIAYSPKRGDGCCTTMVL
jgi:hypothetical protein